MANRDPWWVTLGREPLVHFVVLGALLFALYEWRGTSSTGSSRIVVTAGQIDAMAAGFVRTWQRPPTDTELKGLIDDHVREELATREAMALGLDRDDTIIRRRLRQKFEFASEDAIDAVPLSDDALGAWLRNRAAQYRREPEVAFRQVYINGDRRGARAEADARDILERLRAGGASASRAGDPSLLPGEVDLSPVSDVARQFGEAFAEAVSTLQPGAWTGPVRSSLGWHAVWVTDRRAGALPSLADVRPLVERDVLADRRARQLTALYDQLLARHRVVIEPGRMLPAPAMPPLAGQR